jgi:hypothetical protein
MGLDITVLTVDWEQLRRTPVERRLPALEEAACPDVDPDLERDLFREPERGWVDPASPEVPWCARYEFHSTNGSYKPHFWAGHAWEDVREVAGPALRAALDAFLSGLFWHDDPPTPPLEGLLHPGGGREGPGLLVACTPADVTRLAARWATAEPLLEGLRAAYGVHAAKPGGWIADFDAFAVLLREWAVVVTEAERRGRGVLGVPY